MPVCFLKNVCMNRGNAFEIISNQFQKETLFLLLSSNHFDVSHLYLTNTSIIVKLYAYIFNPLLKISQLFF